MICTGIVCHQRRSRRSSYNIPTVGHGPPIYSLSQRSFGITSLANEAAVYEAMPESKTMEVGTVETFRRPSTAPLLEQANTHSDVQQNLESVYELDDEMDNRGRQKGSGAQAKLDSTAADGIYEMDDVETAHKPSSTEGCKEQGALPLLQERTIQQESFYEMDDPL